jgi:hypothetical protein
LRRSSTESFSGQVGVAFRAELSVVDVGLVVLAVVDLHRLGVDVGLKGVGGIGKRGKRVGHVWCLQGVAWCVTRGQRALGGAP